jgi:hypothetical protein
MSSLGLRRFVSAPKVCMREHVRGIQDVKTHWWRDLVIEDPETKLSIIFFNETRWYAHG